MSMFSWHETQLWWETWDWKFSFGYWKNLIRGSTVWFFSSWLTKKKGGKSFQSSSYRQFYWEFEMKNFLKHVYVNSVGWSMALWGKTYQFGRILRLNKCFDFLSLLIPDVDTEWSGSRCWVEKEEKAELIKKVKCEKRRHWSIVSQDVSRLSEMELSRSWQHFSS